MNTIANKRMITIANVETGEVKRVDAVAANDYFLTDKTLKKQIWFACEKRYWKQFKDLNPEYIADDSKDFVGLKFVKVIPQSKQKASDYVYSINSKDETVAILINVNAGGKGYNRKDSRKWEGRTSERRNNNRSFKNRDRQVVKIGSELTPVVIKLNQLDDVVVSDPLELHRMRKGGKQTITNVSGEPTYIRKYSKDLVKRIKNQLEFGVYKRETYGAVIAHDESENTVTVLIKSNKKIKGKTIHHINADGNR